MSESGAAKYPRHYKNNEKVKYDFVSNTQQRVLEV